MNIKPEHKYIEVKILKKTDSSCKLREIARPTTTVEILKQQFDGLCEAGDLNLDT